VSGHLAFSIRSLRRTPGLTTAAVPILGLGIGMATAVFSLFESILVRPLPIQDPDRVAVLWPVDRVAADLHYRELEASTPTIFLHYRQLPFWQGTIVVRTRGGPATAVRSIVDAITRATPEMPVWRVEPRTDALAAPLARPRFTTALLTVYAVAAVARASASSWWFPPW